MGGQVSRAVQGGTELSSRRPQKFPLVLSAAPLQQRGCSSCLRRLYSKRASEEPFTELLPPFSAVSVLI